MDTLVCMGFPAAHCERALGVCGGSAEAAIEFLMANAAGPICTNKGTLGFHSAFFFLTYKQRRVFTGGVHTGSCFKSLFLY